MKNNIFIMGDSYSTYEGYIPKGYAFYYGDERKDQPVIRGVEKTWWSIFAKENNLNITLNDSYSGSTICNTVRENYPVESSFVSRIDKYISEKFFDENRIDTLFIFGGTNDSWIDSPVGNTKYLDWTDDDLKCVLPAFCYLISKAKKAVEDTVVIINTDLKKEITDGFIEACEKNSIRYVRLKEIDKENGHPTELGMKQIAEQVAKYSKNMNTHTHEYKLFKKLNPSMRYDGSTDFFAWQKNAKQKLNELLGLPLESCDANLEIEYKKELEECIEYRFTVQTEPDYYVPCRLLVPKNVSLPAPLTICLSGHGGGMHIALGRAKTESDEKALSEWHHRAMGPRSIKEGRCALIIEARSFGECSLDGYGTSCTEAAKIAILSGRTVIGERVWDAMRILDAVSDSFSEVDMSDIVCTGNSGGGTATYYLACVDERITAAAPSCSICTYEASIAARRHCMCNHIPSIRKYFEMGDLAGLIAPRKLVIAAGMLDGGFPIAGTREAFEQVQSCYRALSAENNCALVVADGDHLNYADHLWSKLHEMGV
ncbi:MAG: hypothetical protein E7395_06035 [Ruminococcaceae bacterium]|nr:hypothetical protein [Oscillospiraceae bacterium]